MLFQRVARLLKASLGLPIAILILSSGLMSCRQDSRTDGNAGHPSLLLPISSSTGLATNRQDIRGHIVFVSNRDGPSVIYSMRADGSDQRHLTHSQGDDAWPSFSPNGKQIVYESEVGGHPQIFLMGADGSQPVNLTASQSSDEFPTWSPDGSRIAFTSDRDGHSGIYIMNSDGSGAHLITDHPSNNWFPVWSPDGGTVAFLSDRDGSHGNVFLMDPAGNHLKQITTETNLAAKPAWAPDGGRLAVFTGGGFFAISRDGNDPQPITEDGEDPAWSPDGRWIAFASRREENRLQIYLIAPDGSSVSRITHSAADDWAPAWGP